ncbi:leucyl aminopeptidase [Prosthecomicrobium sp. N25]|uniref:leucyl aminopeptidase n=1 Tax=Prosthecomicrobium sp. N25 TaxID=3129254 RepID=UPI00307746C5
MPLATIAFQKPVRPETGTLVLLAEDGGALGAAAKALDEATGGTLARALSASAFKGKQFATLEILAPAGSALDRILVVGLGKPAEMKENDWSRLGGTVLGKLADLKVEEAVLMLDRADGGAFEPAVAAEVALGAVLRSYRFDRYKTKKKDDEANGGKSVRLTLALEGHAAAKKAWSRLQGVAEGVVVARDLVIEPPNVLSPEEFARRARELEKLGVEVEVLNEKEMKKLGMGAFLGVGQGSSRPPRLVVMRWNGGKDKDKPVAFIGKGVVFDTGGISIKPAQGMEDMKGDMAGAACVTGLMHALAARKAKVNVIGAIGVVENMPDGNAQRPGDIVKSMSGQTIEIINTDAEGRLVLADVLWYVKETYQPRFMLDLATLTGAIMVALGKVYAGMFSTSDDLAAQLSAAGDATGERVWRMPLAADYDKMIDSQFADMKNTGGRFGGSITAAQFLKRFVGDTPWVHLDIAGTGMDSTHTETSKAWASGWGVRLLDRLVAENYEK